MPHHHRFLPEFIVVAISYQFAGRSATSSPSCCLTFLLAPSSSSSSMSPSSAANLAASVTTSRDCRSDLKPILSSLIRSSLPTQLLILFPASSLQTETYSIPIGISLRLRMCFNSSKGLNRRMKKFSETFNGFLGRIIDYHVGNEQEKKQNQDFVDTMMTILDSGEAGFEFDLRYVKDMFTAGTDTSSALGYEGQI